MNENKKYILMVVIILIGIVATVWILSLINSKGTTVITYTDTKDTVVNLAKYNKLKSGMSEEEAWDVLGGKCTQIVTTGLDLGNQFVITNQIAYGCNCYGKTDCKVILLVQNGKLVITMESGLE